MSTNSKNAAAGLKTFLAKYGNPFADAAFIREYNHAIQKKREKAFREVRLRIRTNPEQYKGLYEAMRPTQGMPFVVNHPTYRSVEFEVFQAVGFSGTNAT